MPGPSVPDGVSHRRWLSQVDEATTVITPLPILNNHFTINKQHETTEFTNFLADWTWEVNTNVTSFEAIFSHDINDLEGSRCKVIQTHWHDDQACAAFQFLEDISYVPADALIEEDGGSEIHNSDTVKWDICYATGNKGHTLPDISAMNETLLSDLHPCPELSGNPCVPEHVGVLALIRKSAFSLNLSCDQLGGYASSDPPTCENSLVLTPFTFIVQCPGHPPTLVPWGKGADHKPRLNHDQPPAGGDQAVPPPFLPSPTPFVPGTGNATASIQSDPHFVGLRGQKFDITGEAKKIYCLISDEHLLVNARFDTAFTTGMHLDINERTGEATMQPMRPKGTWMTEIIVRVGQPTRESDGEETILVSSMYFSTDWQADLSTKAGNSGLQTHNAILRYGSYAMDHVPHACRDSDRDQCVNIAVHNKASYTKIAVVWNASLAFDVDIVSPPSSWKIVESQIARYSHLNFQLHAISLSSSASGLLGCTQNLKYNLSGNVVMGSGSPNGEGIIVGSIGEYEVSDLGLDNFAFSASTLGFRDGLEGANSWIQALTKS